MRVEDHVIDFVYKKPINVQGDRYMDTYGTMYILTDNPHHMDKWGSEQLSSVDTSTNRLVNTIKVRSVIVDDPNLGVYQWDNHGEISYI